MYKHGLESHRLYDTWSNMVRRCHDINHTCYHKYGEKGIQVCAEWRETPTVFIRWMENQGWEEGLTIDRRDPRGNYCPENCRLLTLIDQNRNRTTTKLTVEDVKYIREFCRTSFGMSNYRKAKILALELNQNFSTIRNVVEGRTWKEV